MGEFGPQNLRINTTYGQYIHSHQRIKFSGEYLTQQHTYTFFSGNESKFVHQYALGAAYQFKIPSSFHLPWDLIESLDLGYAYSHAFDRRLSSFKRIAGADGSFAYIGTSLNLPSDGFLSVKANYNHVRYPRKFETKIFASGLGGALDWIQPIGRFALEFSSEWNPAFDFYEASIHSAHIQGILDLGIYANYTQGKKSLPNYFTAGLQFRISLSRLLWNGKSPCSVPNLCEKRCPTYWSNLAAWVSHPAVYIPIVLAVSDQRTLPCAPPTSDPIPPQDAVQGVPVNIPLASYFHSTSPLTFSATGLPPGLVIDPNSGTITGTPTTMGTFDGIVTATSACGFTAQGISITVQQTCTPPTSDPIPNQTIPIGTPVNIPLASFFHSSFILTYSAVGLPPNLVINPSTGTITGTPVAPGQFSAIVTATSMCGSTSQPISITVNCVAPTSSPIPNQTVTLGSAVNIPLAPYFSSPIALTYTATGLPPGLNINSATGTINGIPSALGTYSATITATSICGSTSQPLSITVTCNPPTSDPIPDRNVRLNQFTVIPLATFFHSAFPLTYSATGLPRNLSINSSTGTITGVPIQLGTFLVTVTATSICGSTFRTFQIIVRR